MMATSKHAGRRRFITREHNSDTSEADASTLRTSEGENVDRRRLESVDLLRDAPSAFVRVKPSSQSASIERTFRESRNGLALTSAQRLTQPTLVPTNSDHDPQLHLVTERLIKPLRSLTYAAYAPKEDSSGFRRDCDDSSLGFRPIRRDSFGSESSSLAGSTVDNELTTSNAPGYAIDSPQNYVKPPPHPGVKDLTDSSSKLRPWSYYEGGVTIPRSLMSSTGSASSYDNLDKPETLMLTQKKNSSKLKTDLTPIHAPRSPNVSRMKHFESTSKRTPSPPYSERATVRHGDTFRCPDDKQLYVPGNGRKANEHGKDVSTDEKSEGPPHFLEGVCRRRMAGGHVRVIPPLQVGVFDPSRILQTNAHTPKSEITDSSMETFGPGPTMSSVRQTETVQPSESFLHTFLPHTNTQRFTKSESDHVSNVHPKPFALKDGGIPSTRPTKKKKVPTATLR